MCSTHSYHWVRCLSFALQNLPDFIVSEITPERTHERDTHIVVQGLLFECEQFLECLFPRYFTKQAYYLFSQGDFSERNRAENIQRLLGWQLEQPGTKCIEGSHSSLVLQGFQERWQRR